MDDTLVDRENGMRCALELICRMVSATTYAGYAARLGLYGVAEAERLFDEAGGERPGGTWRL